MGRYGDSGREYRQMMLEVMVEGLMGEEMVKAIEYSIVVLVILYDFA